MMNPRRCVHLLVVLASGLLAFSAPRLSGGEEPSLPDCATDGDLDGDGVPDALDSDERDSCSLTSTGFEDCLTGAGDGLPDCK